MAQLEGKVARAWLASHDADPGLLLRHEAEAVSEDAGGTIIGILDSGIVIQTSNGSRLVRLRELDRWVVQDVPVALLRRIESSLQNVPASHLARLRDEGFDVSSLIQQQVRLTYGVIEAVDLHREADFTGIEAVGHMLGTPVQYGAARRVLETVMAAPFVRASGSARIRLADHASSKGDVSRVKALTENALPRSRALTNLTEDVRGKLLTIRAACLGRFALDCEDIAEARHAVDAAYAILGKAEHVTTTYSSLRKRAEALRCGW